MAEILKIGDTYVPAECITDISEKEVSTSRRVKDGWSYRREVRTFRVVVLTVSSEDVSSPVTPMLSISYDGDDDCTQLGTTMSGPHYQCFTIYSDPDFFDAMETLKKNLRSADRESSVDIIRTLSSIGMSRTFGGWERPNYLQTCMLLDPDVKSKQDFMRKYMD